MPRPNDIEAELTSSYHISKPQSLENRTCCQRICGCLFGLFNVAMFTAGFLGLWNLLGKPTNRQDAVAAVQTAWGHLNVSDFNNVLQNLTETEWDLGFDEDPFVGDNTTNVWATNGQDGLALTLLNALDETWQNEFYEAVSDWRESEVLSLETEIVEVDNTCTHVDGVMKVCNGNFGKTGWMGINEAMLEYTSKDDPGVIVASVAKMNEFYLNNADYARRQYTMCHEIGHGFGLPHTDENFNNQNQGNCLDYTNSPESNMHPGDVNFARLITMYMANSSSYGNDDATAVDDYVVVDDYTVADDYAAVVDDDDGANDDDAAATENGNGRRYLRRIIVRHYLYV